MKTEWMTCQMLDMRRPEQQSERFEPRTSSSLALIGHSRNTRRLVFRHRKIRVEAAAVRS